MFVRFGDFTFDREAKSLLRRGRLVHLTPRALKLLALLLDNRPRPMPRVELERRLWPDSQVAESNLANLVVELRRALDDDSRVGLIRTLHGFGYSFIGGIGSATDRTPGSSTFRVWMAGTQIGLEHGENWIGRAVDCRVQVDCALVSRHHACIVVADGDATLKDGKSRNGTFLNDRRLSRATPLHHRDQIRLGTIHLGFRIVRPDDPTDGELAS